MSNSELCGSDEAELTMMMMIMTGKHFAVVAIIPDLPAVRVRQSNFMGSR